MGAAGADSGGAGKSVGLSTSGYGGTASTAVAASAKNTHNVI